ncbi:MAG: asparagine synthase (glutamine-hydrolyzing) [Candidatus Acidiferrum sp.]
MCGIAGIISPRGVDPATLVAMTQIISYRGPDGFGFAYAQLDREAPVAVFQNQAPMTLSANAAVGLGNRRLAILDTSCAGNQPMQTPDGDLTITYNGEIYNYKELRAELQEAGRQFRTHTDTEVILEAYRAWGQDCVQRFNGMWAFALWDRTRQLLFCSRDRFGVKPFYFLEFQGAFYFASEIKQILRAAPLPRKMNPKVATLFVEWGLLDSSAETFFEGIRQLPGGHNLLLSPAKSSATQIRRYWELQTEPQLDINESEAEQQFNDLFRSAVEIRLRSDVPLGVALSGGLDSSSVLCQAKRIAPDSQLQTFSACFEEKQLDEREYIQAALSMTDAIGHATYPQESDFWKSLRSMIYHQDEPVGSPAAYPQWCVMAESRAKAVPVILGGQGGDESLCGYQKYHFFYLWYLLTHASPRFFREAYFWLKQGTKSYGSPGSMLRYLPSALSQKYSLVRRIGSPELVEQLLLTRPRIGHARTIAERQKIDLTYSSIPALLHHEDRASMAHSVESRLPFLDYRLVEFSLRCSTSLKLRDGWTKWLLRRSLAGILPEKICLRRTKLGFNTPEQKWLQHGMQNGHRNIWEGVELHASRLFDSQKFQQECRKFVAGEPGALPSSILFRAISLEQWAQVYSMS